MGNKFSEEEISIESDKIKKITAYSIGVIAIFSCSVGLYVIKMLSASVPKLMTNELNEKLNEASRQKKQIETILLHMTDGIIAFDLNGEIMHINPAATQLLKLDKNDNNFDKIFKKLDININMEKIIYLENWTSSEQKVNLQDRYVNMLFAPYKDENDRPARCYCSNTGYYRAC